MTCDLIVNVAYIVVYCVFLFGMYPEEFSAIGEMEPGIYNWLIASFVFYCLHLLHHLTVCGSLSASNFAGHKKFGNCINFGLIVFGIYSFVVVLSYEWNTDSKLIPDDFKSFL